MLLKEAESLSRFSEVFSMLTKWSKSKKKPPPIPQPPYPWVKRKR